MAPLLSVPHKPGILIIDDDRGHLDTLADILDSEGFTPLCCQTGDAALEACAQHEVHVAILDLRLGDRDGLDFLRQLCQQQPALKIIIHTGYASLDSAMAAVNQGAFAYVQKEGNVEELLAHVHRAFHTHLAGYSAALEHEVQRRTEALRESEARYRALAEQALVGVYITQQGRFLYVNPRFAEIFGYTPEEVITTCRSGHDLVIPEDRALAQENIRKREQGEVDSPHYTFRGQRKDGTQLEVEVHGSTMTVDGAPATIGVLLDITERKQAEEERQRLEGQLRQSQKMEAIGTLAGGIAHDFNNILAILMHCLSLIEDEVPHQNKALEYVQHSQDALIRAKDLVQQILAFSRRDDRVRAPVQMPRLVKDTLALLRAALPTTIDIQQHISEEGGTILADATQIHQIMLNLCTNAAHAMRDTGGILEVRLATTQVDATLVAHHPDLQPGPHAHVTVRDTGHGMAPDVLERIFDPFYTTKGVGEGTGMGLALVHGIVASHHGAITVESTVGIGTTFEMYLPLCLPRIDPTTGTPIYAEAVIPHGRGCILFVDDEVMLADLGQIALEQLGYEVVARTSSLEALEAFRAMPQRFDVVVTDQTMPHMTGEQLASALRRIRPDIPIILCTGFSYTMTAEKAEAVGIDAFCIKPVGARDLAVTIQQVLDQRSE